MDRLTVIRICGKTSNHPKAAHEAHAKEMKKDFHTTKICLVKIYVNINLSSLSHKVSVWSGVISPYKSLDSRGRLAPRERKLFIHLIKKE